MPQSTSVHIDGEQTMSDTESPSDKRACFSRDRSTAELEELRVQLWVEGRGHWPVKGLGAPVAKNVPRPEPDKSTKRVIGEALGERKVALGSAEALLERNQRD